jgi:Rieske 2Fe-2S family protein
MKEGHSTMTAPDNRGPEQYTGLKQLEEGLPSHYYYDPAHYERELQAIWHRNWIYVCRASTLAEASSFRTFTIGGQSILVVRDEKGVLRAFHNTCRHRGSALCAEPHGKLRGKAITCRYHGWSYDLRGRLAAVPALGMSADFDRRNFPLYDVALAEWGGSVFVNLAASPKPLEETLRPNAQRLANWPMAELTVGHVVRTKLACNWKIFWENFSECYHCPGVHPELCSLVPIYGRSISNPYDDPDWASHRDDPNPKFRGGLRPGAVTWSLDGGTQGAAFPGLSAEEQAAGHRFVTLWPTMYAVGHIDYMRIVSMRPLAPEETELTIEWLFSEETLANPQFDIENAVGMARLVVEQDGAACELNQKGIRSIAHRHGVLMPQEHAVYAFQQWVLRGLAAG